MAHDLPDCNRIGSHDLTSYASGGVRPSAAWLSRATWLYYSASSSFLAIFSWLIWEPGVLAAAGLFAWGIGKDRSATKAHFAREFERRELQLRRFAVLPVYAPAAQPLQANGIASRMWIADKETHETLRKQFRRLDRTAVDDPPAEYRLALASLKVDGNTQRVAFADGQVINWNSRRPVYMLPTETLEIGADAPEADAEALEALVDALASRGDAASLGTLRTWFGEHHEARLVRALHAGEVWSLIRVVRGDVDFVDALLGGSLPGSPLVELTHAGRLWLLCSDENRAARERRAKLSSSHGPKFNFYKGSQNNVNYVEGDLIGQTTRFGDRPADDEVLKALDRLLQAGDLPWADPEIRPVRVVIERAVENRDVQQPAVRGAVRTLVERCGGAIALGVAGNTVYEVLKAFAL